MIDRRVLYWSGPLFIPWLWMLEQLDYWLQRSWEFRWLEGVVTPRLWIGIVATYFGVLGSAALATHLVFFLKHPREKSSFTTASFLLAHLLLCAVVLGTGMVLHSPGVFNKLKEFNLDFLPRFLFYVAVVWSNMAVLDSLMPRTAALTERK